MMREKGRKTPDELLREVQAEEAAATKGHLKIFLGYASGVGKSFRMLDEARRRRERGQDIVIGAVQPKVPPEVEVLLNKLEVVPLKVTGKGQRLMSRRSSAAILPSASSTGWRTITRRASRMRLVGRMFRTS